MKFVISALMLLSFSTISFAVSRSTERAWLRCTQNHCGGYAGPGGACYTGPGGPCYNGPGGDGENCSWACE